MAISACPGLTPLRAGTLPSIDLLQKRLDHVPAFLVVRLRGRSDIPAYQKRGWTGCASQQLLVPSVARAYGAILTAAAAAPWQMDPNAHAALLADAFQKAMGAAAPRIRTPKSKANTAETWDLI